jgi:type II secretion system protein H
MNDSRVTFTRKNGFTLMELLVVIVIISIAFSLFITVNFSFSNPSDAIHKEALRLQRLLEFAHEQSVLRAEEYGLRVNEARYRFMRLDELTGKWVELEQDKLLRARDLPDSMNFELSIEDVDVILDREDAEQDDPDVELKPQVFLLSSGELTPDFKLRLRFAGFDDYYELHGMPMGKYELAEIKDE